VRNRVGPVFRSIGGRLFADRCVRLFGRSSFFFDEGIERVVFSLLVRLCLFESLSFILPSTKQDKKKSSRESDDFLRNELLRKRDHRFEG